MTKTALLSLVLVLVLLPGMAVAQPALSEAQILLELRAVFNNSEILNSWQGDNPCKGWLGIECDSQGSVSSINLNGVGLRGSIPPTVFQLPTNVQGLDLSANYLTGTLPADWRFPSLRSLNLGMNQFTGTMPAFLLSNDTTYFNVGTNLLTGTLPPDFKIPTSMVIMTLDTNLLTGTIPASWELPSSLLWLSLCCQNLSGSIPDSWSFPPRNDTLSPQLGLFNNLLTGSVPAWKSSAPVTLYVRPGNPGLCGKLPKNPKYHTYTSTSILPTGTPLEALGNCKPVTAPAAEPAAAPVTTPISTSSDNNGTTTSNSDASRSSSSSSNTVAIAVGLGVGLTCLVLVAVAWIMWRRRKRSAHADEEKAPAPADDTTGTELKGSFGTDKTAEIMPAPLGSNTYDGSNSTASLGSLPADLSLSRVTSKMAQGDSPSSDGSTSAGALGSEKPSLTSSDQTKPDIDVSLWKISFQELSLLLLVGKGSFGRVYKAEWTHRTIVAVKVLDAHWPELAGVQDAQVESGTALPCNVLAKLQQEASLLAALRHPNVVAFLGLVSSPPCLVTEYCPRGSLYDTLQQARKSPAVASQLQWARRINMALDAARGMAYLHSLKPPVLHRDLKSNNLLVCDNWTIKVADFSVSKIWQESAVASSGAEVGNPRWLAPEVLSGMSHTPASDVYSFGIVLWELLTWELPWAGCGTWQVSTAVIEGERPDMPSPEVLAQDVASLEALPAYLQLTERCWAQNPEDRPSFAEIVWELRGFRRSSLDQAARQANGLALGTQGLAQSLVKRVTLSPHRETSPFMTEKSMYPAEQSPR